MRGFFAICLTTFAAIAVGAAVTADAQPKSPERPMAAAEATLARQAPLKPASAFAGIADTRQRSLALYGEAARVLTHPRCANCHPPDDKPRQGAEARVHNPPMVFGMGGHGPAGQPCSTCHGKENFAVGGDNIRSIPGNPKWALAPVEMAWLGKSPGEICRQIKDPARNGGKDLEALWVHMAHDELVGWGWNPGAGRAPAPGDQATFGGLIRAWIDTGAVCPT